MRSERPFVWLGRRADRILVVLGALMLAAYAASLVLLPKPDGRVVMGDAVQHYVQLRSLALDGDLDFRNDFAIVYGFDEDGAVARDWIEERLTPTGYVRNYMPIGPALVWLPIFVLTAVGLRLLDALGMGVPDGTAEWALQAGPGITGVMAATLAAWVAWRLAARLTDRSSAAVGVLGVWLGSHALYYSQISPAYSHSLSMLAGGLVLWHWIARRDRWTVPVAMSAGALAGLAALMRWQDALLVALAAIESVRQPAPLGRRLGLLAAVGGGFVVAFSPQMAVWAVLYGQPFAVPQGPSFIEWTSPNLVAVLFSDYHGLFAWSPILLLAVWGGMLWLRRDRALAGPILVVILLSWYVNAAVADWWAGEAYGARRFLSLFPLFVVGLSAWVQPVDGRPRTGRLLTVAALVVANGLLLVQYQAFMKGLRDLAPYPEGVNLWLARFAVPFRLLGHWLG